MSTNEDSIELPINPENEKGLLYSVAEFCEFQLNERGSTVMAREVGIQIREIADKLNKPNLSKSTIQQINLASYNVGETTMVRVEDLGKILGIETYEVDARFYKRTNLKVPGQTTKLSCSCCGDY